MNFNMLKYIVEVVETGSISRAANNLYISQPTLSTQISTFEKELGQDIFIRGNRGIILTNYGVEVYKEAKSLIEQFEITKKKLTAKVNDNKIKIAAFGSPVINQVFLEVIEEYDEDNYEFVLNECGIEKSIELVEGKESDIGIIFYSPYQLNKLSQNLQHRGLEMKNLFNGWLKLHISSNWNISRKSVINSEDLKNLLYVKLSYVFHGIFNFDYEVQKLGIPQDNKVLLTNSKLTYNEALDRFPSFSVVVDWNCKKQIDSSLKRIPFEDKELVVTCAVVKRKNEVLKDELNTFIDKLIQSYGKDVG